MYNFFTLAYLASYLVICVHASYCIPAYSIIRTYVARSKHYNPEMNCHSLEFTADFISSNIQCVFYSIFCVHTIQHQCNQGTKDINSNL
jgi:hypothetical protein